MDKSKELGDGLPIKSLLVVVSYHHKNTEKIAGVLAKILDAQIKTPQQILSQELQEYDLIGFGSGIYDDKHHQLLLDLVDRFPQVTNRKAFIFSTCGAPGISFSEEYREKTINTNHLTLRNKLKSRGYTIIGEYSCRGFNTNSFLRILGGINKGRPNAEDLKNAEEFGQNLKKLCKEP